MLILVLDATAGACAAALVQEARLVAHRSEEMDKGHAERLFPMVREMMGATSLSAIEAIAVCTGPGNFTGARIGVAAARGLALSLGVPAVGVDRFAAAGIDEGCIVLPGRGQSVHAALFKNGSEVAAATIDRADIAAFAEGRDVTESAAVDLRGIAAVAERLIAKGATDRPAPRYLRPVNAALPSEAPPPLLP